MSRSSLLSGAAVVACIVAAGTPACAQSARDFNIPSGPMRDALTAFGAQSGQQIFFASDLVAGRRSPGVNGRMEPEAALSRLLRDSGLTWSQSRPGVFVVQRTARTTNDEVTVLDEVVVTGTLLRSSGDPASPVTILTRDELDRRGYGTVAETLAALPQNYGTSTPLSQATMSDASTSNNVFSTGVNLRGLGAASTLVLVNGRRLAGTGARAEFADISALPSAAVERVDILLDGASALYGADAVAGVVNVLMRRSFDGQESRLRIASARSGGEDVQASHLFGKSWASGSAYLSYEYQTANGLSALDRPYTADGDLRPFGGSDRRTFYSSPGNIVEFDPAVSAYVTRFGIRPNASGTAQIAADFAPGQPNLQSPMLDVDLLPAVERHSVYGRVRQAFGDRLELTADLRYSRRDNEIASSATTSVFSVSTTNPWFVSPVGATSHMIGYSFARDLGPARSYAQSESLGLTVGLRYELSDNWALETYLAKATEIAEYGFTNRVNNTFLAEALGNVPDNPETQFNPAVDGYFNPFGAGAANNRAVLDFISGGYGRVNNESEARSANVLIQGDWFNLPGGQMSVAVGAQVRQELFDNRGETFLVGVTPRLFPSPTRERSVSALFAEARLPLVGPDNARPGVQSLDVSVAARVEDYDDFGTTTNPKLGVVWSPLERLTLRASWGTSFRAGALQQIFEEAAVSPAFLDREDGSEALVLLLIGGNRNLKPETSQTLTAGFDYRFATGSNLSVNVFETRFEDRIAQPVNANFDGALIDPSLRPFVVFVNPASVPADLALVESYAASPGFSPAFPTTAYGAVVDTRWVNTGDVRVSGVDIAGRHAWRFVQGELAFDASVSWVLDYASRSTPAAPVQRLAGRLGYPADLRARTGLTWSRGEWQVGGAWNFVDSYRDSVGSRIDAWNTADASIAWSPTGRRLGGLRLQLTAQNLFDQDPPFYDSPSGYGFDAGQANPLGRVVSLQLIRRW